MNSKQAMEGRDTESQLIGGSANQTSNKDCLIKYHQVDNTPFTIVERQEGCIGVMGNNQITGLFDSVEEARKNLEEFNWDRVLYMIMIITKEGKNE